MVKYTSRDAIYIMKAKLSKTTTSHLTHWADNTVQAVKNVSRDHKSIISTVKIR